MVLWKEGRYPEARAAVTKFLQQFPQTEYSENAQYWIGEAYLKEGKIEEAILAFEDVVKNFLRAIKFLMLWSSRAFALNSWETRATRG